MCYGRPLWLALRVAPGRNMHTCGSHEGTWEGTETITLHPRPTKAPTTVAAFLLCWAFCAVSSAQMAITPVMVENRTIAGGLATFMLSVSNSGNQPIDCGVRVTGMTVLPGGLPVEAQDPPRNCKDWITVEPTKFALRPGEGQGLLCRLRVPKDAAGGYYAIISCQGIPNTGTAGDSAEAGVGVTMKLTHRGLVPVLVTVPGPQVQAIIDAAPPAVLLGLGGRGYTFDLPVRNRGNIHARMAGFVELRSDAGQLVERFDMEAGRGFILPMHERLFQGYIPLNLADGSYVAGVQLGPRGQAPMRSVFPFYVKEGVPTVAEPTEELKAQLLKSSAGFMVSPAQLDVEIQAGARRAQAIELINLTREVLPVSVSVVEWVRQSDGVDVVGTGTPTHGRSAVDCVSLGQESIELRPMSRQRVPVTVALPKDATGSRYAAVLFDRADVKLDASARGQARRSTMLQVAAQGTGTQGAEITDFRAERESSGAIRFVAKIRNTGDLSLSAEVRVTVSSADGAPIGGPAPVTPPAVQAATDATVAVRWEQVLEPGDYTAQLSVQYSPKAPSVYGNTTFTVPRAQPDSNPATQPAAEPAARPTTAAQEHAASGPAERGQP